MARALWDTNPVGGWPHMVLISNQPHGQVGVTTGGALAGGGLWTDENQNPKGHGRMGTRRGS